LHIKNQVWNPPAGILVEMARSFARFGARTMVAMENDKIVAVGLLTQTNLRMLGSSLKIVFSVDEDTTEFDELLQALDRLGERHH
jgi:hypothetical protein